MKILIFLKIYSTLLFYYSENMKYDSDWLMKCKDIIIRLFAVLRNFLTLDMQQSKRRDANNGLLIVGRNGDSIHMHNRTKLVCMSYHVFRQFV